MFIYSEFLKYSTFAYNVYSFKNTEIVFKSEHTQGVHFKQN